LVMKKSKKSRLYCQKTPFNSFLIKILVMLILKRWVQSKGGIENPFNSFLIKILVMRC